MLYSKRRKNLGGGRRKRSNRKFNGRGMRGGSSVQPKPNPTITVKFKGDWGALTKEIQDDIKMLFEYHTPTKQFIGPQRNFFTLNGPKNSNVTEFDTTLAKLELAEFHPVVTEHPDK
jgi:hypothetical protein